MRTPVFCGRPGATFVVCKHAFAPLKIAPLIELWFNWVLWKLIIHLISFADPLWKRTDRLAVPWTWRYPLTRISKSPLSKRSSTPAWKWSKWCCEESENLWRDNTDWHWHCLSRRRCGEEHRRHWSTIEHPWRATPARWNTKRKTSLFGLSWVVRMKPLWSVFIERHFLFGSFVCSNCWLCEVARQSQTFVSVLFSSRCSQLFWSVICQCYCPTV